MIRPRRRGEISPAAWRLCGAIADKDRGPRFEAWLKTVFAPRARSDGIEPKPRDSDDVNSLRGTLCDAERRSRIAAARRGVALRYLDQPSAVAADVVASCCRWPRPARRSALRALPEK